MVARSPEALPLCLIIFKANIFPSFFRANKRKQILNRLKSFFVSSRALFWSGDVKTFSCFFPVDIGRLLLASLNDKVIQYFVLFFFRPPCRSINENVSRHSKGLFIKFKWKFFFVLLRNEEFSVGSFIVLCYKIGMNKKWCQFFQFGFASGSGKWLRHLRALTFNDFNLTFNFNNELIMRNFSQLQFEW